ncbi:MAG: domain containing protein [Frankiales bacterium]|nr:domain containing protein [Frankiales bacterium]
MPVFCTQCGHQNPDDSRFCAQCGAALPAPQPSGTGGDTTSTISLSALEGALARSEAADQASGAPRDHAAAAPEEPPAGTALLVVKRGPNAGSRFLLDADVTTAGRHPESDIFLDDVTVSRRHAEFVRQGDTFLVRDVGSLNGTYLDRERIESVSLTGGDEVQIGKYRLVFHVGRSGTDPVDNG